jgi:hypothetical protein
MRPPFDMLRAAFWLLAFVIGSQVVAIIFGSWTCFYLLIVGAAHLGDCGGFGTQAKEMWSEVLAAILALLLAARGPQKPPD